MAASSKTSKVEPDLIKLKRLPEGGLEASYNGTILPGVGMWTYHTFGDLPYVRIPKTKKDLESIPMTLTEDGKPDIGFLMNKETRNRLEPLSEAHMALSHKAWKDKSNQAPCDIIELVKKNGKTTAEIRADLSWYITGPGKNVEWYSHVQTEKDIKHLGYLSRQDVVGLCYHEKYEALINHIIKKNTKKNYDKNPVSIFAKLLYYDIHHGPNKLRRFLAQHYGELEMAAWKPFTESTPEIETVHFPVIPDERHFKQTPSKLRETLCQGHICIYQETKQAIFRNLKLLMLGKSSLKQANILHTALSTLIENFDNEVSLEILKETSNLVEPEIWEIWKENLFIIIFNRKKKPNNPSDFITKFVIDKKLMVKNQDTIKGKEDNYGKVTIKMSPKETKGLWKKVRPANTVRWLIPFLYTGASQEPLEEPEFTKPEEISEFCNGITLAIKEQESLRWEEKAERTFQELINKNVISYKQIAAINKGIAKASPELAEKTTKQILERLV